MIFDAIVLAGLPGLRDLLDDDLPQRKVDYNDLCAKVDPEEEPYRSKYAARDLMVHHTHHLPWSPTLHHCIQTTWRADVLKAVDEEGAESDDGVRAMDAIAEVLRDRESTIQDPHSPSRWTCSWA